MRTALLGGRIVDGTGEVLAEDGAIVLDGTTIKYSGPRAAHNCEAVERKVDISGNTALPGLFNCHVHLCHLTPEDEQFSHAPVAISALLAAKYSRQLLEAGVTTARDAGSYHEGIVGVRDAIEGGLIAGPRLLVSVRAITTTGGHWHSVAVEADGPDEVRKRAREQLKAGADFVKLIATGGVGTPGQMGDETQFSLDEIRAAVDVARRAGKAVAAHAHPERGIIDSVEAGVTSVEHGTGVSLRAAGLMVERGVFLVPTMQIYHLIATEGSHLGVPGWKVENAKRCLEIQFRNLPNAIREGVEFAFGTDSGGRYCPHSDVVTEMKLLLEAGLSSEQIIASATGVSAKACGLDGQVGFLRPGRVADVVVVEGNPLEDVSAFRKVLLVFKAGQLIIDKRQTVAPVILR